MHELTSSRLGKSPALDLVSPNRGPSGPNIMRILREIGYPFWLQILDYVVRVLLAFASVIFVLAMLELLARDKGPVLDRSTIGTIGDKAKDLRSSTGNLELRPSIMD